LFISTNTEGCILTVQPKTTQKNLNNRSGFLSGSTKTVTRKILLALVFVGFLAGCAVNPVTGKRELTFVSEAQEMQLGTENYAFMQQSGGGKYDVDPQLAAYVRDIGNQLAAQSVRALPYEFTVLNSSVPNAWALPGGKIAINRGLLTEMNSEAELGDDDYERYLSANGRPTSVGVSSVIGSSAAQTAGLQAGDEITRYDGARVYSMTDITKVTMTGEPGQNVVIDVV
jgi:membrane-associated protease RseP (regulator of RpoE activity)